MQTKVCARCKVERPVSDFHKHKQTKDGYRSYCKFCRCKNPKWTEDQAAARELFASGLKRCTVCNLVKPLDEFHIDPRHWTGRHTQCKSCLQSPRVKERNALLEQGLKKCSVCKEVKPLTEFHRTPVNYQNPTGRESACRICSNLHRQEILKKPKRKRNHQAACAKVRAQHFNAPGSYTGEDVAKLYEQQQGLCTYRDCNPNCLVDLSTGYEIDHVIPVSRDGTNYPENLQLLCPHCNSSKGPKTHEEFLAFLAET